jgi:exosortase J
MAFAFGAGIVLLMGGRRLFRAALFPIALLWFVNPIPHVFNVLVDLPLQRTSAHVARAFAIALGQHLTPDQMSLMFTPHFGMFIAPGCNGIRGSVTMGFIALIAGYVYKFRPRIHLAVIAAAVLLGYIFNLVRLCALVLYYIVALRIQWLQSRAEMGDYIIGGCLFFFATILLFYAVQRLKSTEAQNPSAVRIPSSFSTLSGAAAFRLAVLCLLALAGSYRAAHAFVLDRATQRNIDNSAQHAFPQKIGNYSRVRTWNETQVTGALAYHWAEYAPADGGTHIDLGISPLLGAHDTLICHSARGEDPLWRDQFAVKMADLMTVSFSASFYNNGATQSLEATTLCTNGTCGEYSSNRQHFGLVFSKPSTGALLSNESQQPIPILLKAETIDMSKPSDLARRDLLASMMSFLQSADLAALTHNDRSK